MSVKFLPETHDPILTRKEQYTNTDWGIFQETQLSHLKKVIKDKERLRDCHRLEKAGKGRQLMKGNTLGSDPIGKSLH